MSAVEKAAVVPEEFPILTKHQFISRVKKEPQKFFIKALGGWMFYKPASQGDRAHARKLSNYKDQEDSEKLEAAMVIVCATDSTGKRFFEDTELPVIMGIEGAGMEINSFAAAISGLSGNP